MTKLRAQGSDTRPIATVVALSVAFVAGLVLTAILADPSGVAFFAAYAGIGSFLAVRQRGNSVGGLLMVVGWGLGIGSIRCTVPVDRLVAGSLDPTEAAIAWANGCGWAYAFLGFLGMVLVFPDGQLPVGRGRLPARILIGAMIVLVGFLSVNPLLTVTPSSTGTSMYVSNPFAVAPSAAFWSLVPDPNTLFVMIFGLVAAGIVFLVVRYGRSVGLQRVQYRWLVAAIALVVVVNLIWAITFVGIQINSPVVWLGVIAGYLSVPIAIAVAILRYRLYEIDRIISRTIAYAVVLGILSAVFGLGIVLLSSALATLAEGRAIAVAASTLLVFAAFQPVLRRVRAVVDRRFDRRRYDADRIAASFSARVRNETDVETVNGDLVETVRSAVAPAVSSVWLRSSGSSGSSR